MTFCTACGSRLVDQVGFCSSCGAPANSDASACSPIEATAADTEIAIAPLVRPLELGVVAENRAQEKPHSGWRRRLVLVGLPVAAVLIIGGLAVAVWLNHERASDWQARATTSMTRVRALIGVVEQRTGELAVRTNALNDAAAKLGTAQNRLQRSEGDVRQLARRQRQLAAEKADIEDQRAALERIATLYSSCTSGLADLLSAVIDNDYTYALSHDDAVYAGCNQAADELNSFQQANG